MNWVDVLVAVSVIWSGLRGYFRGFWTQLVIAASVVLGLLAALWCHAFLATWWGRGSGFTPLALRFLGSIVAGVLVFGLLQVLAERTGPRVNESILGPVNRAFGLALGLAGGLAACALVLLALVQPPLPRTLRHAVRVSWCAPHLFRTAAEGARALTGVVPGAGTLRGAFERAGDRPAERTRPAKTAHPGGWWGCGWARCGWRVT